MPQSGQSFNSNSGADELQGYLDIYGLYQETNSTPGVWFSVSEIKSATVEVSGLESGGTVEIHLHNGPTKPDNTTDGVLDQTAIAANGRFVFAKLPANFCKFKKSASGSPTPTDANFHGLKR